MAQAYDEAYYEANGQLGDRPALRLYTRLARRYLGPGPYLDYGCGTGYLVRRLSRLGRAAGLETSTFSAERARTTAAGCEVFAASDAVPSGEFSGLTAIHVVEHLDDGALARALSCWERVLRPEGRVLVVTPDASGKAQKLMGPKWIGYSDPTHINLKSHAEWRDFLTRRGWKVVKEASDGMWNVPYGRLPKLADALVHAVPALMQFLAGRLLVPPRWGESSIFVVERRPGE